MAARRRAIKGTTAGGRTPLYASIYTALNELEKIRRASDHAAPAGDRRALRWAGHVERVLVRRPPEGGAAPRGPDLHDRAASVEGHQGAARSSSSANRRRGRISSCARWRPRPARRAFFPVDLAGARRRLRRHRERAGASVFARLPVVEHGARRRASGASRCEIVGARREVADARRATSPSGCSRTRGDASNRARSVESAQTRAPCIAITASCRPAWCGSPL